MHAGREQQAEQHEERPPVRPGVFDDLHLGSPGGAAGASVIATVRAPSGRL